MDDETLEQMQDASTDITAVIHKNELQEIINDLKMLMDDDDWFSYKTIADVLCEHLRWPQSQGIADAINQVEPTIKTDTMKMLMLLAKDDWKTVDEFVNKLMFHYETTHRKN